MVEAEKEIIITSDENIKTQNSNNRQILPQKEENPKKDLQNKDEFIKLKEIETNNDGYNSDEEEIKELEKIYLQKKGIITEIKEEEKNKLKIYQINM